MNNLDELQQSISSMSDDELRTRLREIRTARTARVEKPKATAKPKPAISKATLSKLSKEDILKILEEAENNA